MNPEKVGKFIKELREEKKISQYALADMMHVDRTLISKWENGKLAPDLKYLEDLCEIFEIDIKEMLEGERATAENEEQLRHGIFKFFNLQDKKYKKARRISLILFIVTILTMLTFFIYYFYQTYNKIKIYKVYGESENYKIGKGLLVLTRDNSYLNLGNIDFVFDKISIYSLKDDNKMIIFEDSDIKLLSDLPSYDSALNYDNFNDNINNIYIDIITKDKIETIQLHFENEYKNKSFLFRDYSNTSFTNDVYYSENNIPEYIKENYYCDLFLCNYNNKNYESKYIIATKNLNIFVKKDNIMIEYNFINNELTYNSTKHNFSVINNEINCGKKNCDKEKIIYDEIYEKYLKPILE